MKGIEESVFGMEGSLTKTVRAALCNCIREHGPITLSLVKSAEKRVMTAVAGYLVNTTKQDTDNLTIQALGATIELLEKRIKKANSQERRWRRKCVENNIPLGD